MTFVQGSALGGLGMVKRFATGSYPQQMRVQNLLMPVPVVPNSNNEVNHNLHADSTTESIRDHAKWVLPHVTDVDNRGTSARSAQQR